MSLVYIFVYFFQDQSATKDKALFASVLQILIIVDRHQFVPGSRTGIKILLAFGGTLRAGQAIFGVDWLICSLWTVASAKFGII